MKRKVIDSYVQAKVSPVLVYSNPEFKKSKISETDRVSDKREQIRFVERRLPNNISLISNVINIYNTVANGSNEGVIKFIGRQDVTIPVNNLKLLKAIGYCNINPNEEYSAALSEIFVYILKQTLNRTPASIDETVIAQSTKMQSIVKKELLEFYMKECS